MLIALMLLSSCQPAPRPFGRDPDAKTNPLLKLDNARGVSVVHVDGAPPAAARALTREMVAALIELNLPASNKSANRRSHFLIGHATASPAPGNALRVRLRWELLDAGGRVVGNHMAVATLDTRAWNEGARKDLLALVRRSALKLSAIVHGPETVVRRERAQLYPLFVAPVAGGPDGGNRALTQEMFQALKRSGFNVLKTRVPGGYVVAGTVNLGPTAGGNRTVEIVWSVLDSGGKILGRISQGNRVPAASLNGPWDGMARAVTRGAVPGVRNLLRRVGKRTENK